VCMDAVLEVSRSIATPPSQEDRVKDSNELVETFICVDQRGSFPVFLDR
jgi:hypothetical protein